MCCDIVIAVMVKVNCGEERGQGVTDGVMAVKGKRD